MRDSYCAYKADHIINTVRIYICLQKKLNLNHHEVKLKINCITLKKILNCKKIWALVPIIEYLSLSLSSLRQPDWSLICLHRIFCMLANVILQYTWYSLTLCIGSHYLVIFPMIHTCQFVIHTFIKIELTRCRHVLFAHILDLIRFSKWFFCTTYLYSIPFEPSLNSMFEINGSSEETRFKNFHVNVAKNPRESERIRKCLLYPRFCPVQVYFKTLYDRI